MKDFIPLFALMLGIGCSKLIFVVIEHFKYVDYKKRVKEYAIYKKVHHVSSEAIEYLGPISPDACLMEAVSLFLDISWDRAYELLANCGRKYGLILNCIGNVKLFFKDNKKVELIYNNYRGTLTVDQFVQKYKNRLGRYLIITDCHALYMTNGKIYDCNSTTNYYKSPVYCIYKK